jgi:putative DNA primase/helicase
MVHANEPEDNSKFSDGLIKSLTSDEPKGGVRELLKPPFELIITFKNTVMANNMPKIGTDHGIQRRVQVVPWTIIIPDESRICGSRTSCGGSERHPQPDGRRRAALPHRRAVAARGGEGSDPRISAGERPARPLHRPVRRAVKGETIGATPFHRVFAAWQTWAGSCRVGQAVVGQISQRADEAEELQDRQVEHMQWQDVALRYAESDFIDHEGRALDRELPPPRTFPGDAAVPPPPHPPDSVKEDDDDLPF